MKWDLTYKNGIGIIAGAILAVIHFGLVNPIAHELMRKEMGL